MNFFCKFCKCQQKQKAHDNLGVNGKVKQASLLLLAWKHRYSQQNNNEVLIKCITTELKIILLKVFVRKGQSKYTKPTGRERKTYKLAC